MKRGRPHAKLKEQAYLARKDAEGYGRPYEAMPLEPAEPRVAAAKDAEPLPLLDAVDRRSRHALRKALERRDAD
ncbi:MAG TPA: hypothetical protein VM889_10980 [Candidatus Thermoplasmatota archaeon]|nr:hypothetical protein [Candidatus Thermoplasmatota archaeon]